MEHPDNQEHHMPTKQSSSKKTERSSRTPKKGAVRTHTKRAKTSMPDTGLLNDLHRRSYHQATREDDLQVSSKDSDPQATYEANLAAATTLAYNEVGQRVTKMTNGENWQHAVRPMVLRYVKSLFEDEVAAPQELANICKDKINRIFVEITAKRLVGTDVLPGQRQDWYLPMLGEYRERRKAQTAKQSVTPKQFAEQLKRAS